MILHKTSTAAILFAAFSFLCSVICVGSALSAPVHKTTSVYHNWLQSKWIDDDRPYRAIRSQIDSQWPTEKNPIKALTIARKKARALGTDSKAWFEYAYTAFMVKSTPGLHFDNSISQARDDFREVVVASGGAFPSSFNLTRIACLLGVYASSQIPTAERLLDKAPHDDDVRLALAVMLCHSDASGDLKLASAYTDTLVARRPNIESTLLLQELFYETEAYTKSDKEAAATALSFYNKAYQTSPAGSIDRVFIDSARQHLIQTYKISTKSESSTKPNPSSANSETKRIREIYCKWFGEPMTDDDAPYRTIRLKIDKSIAKGDDPQNVLRVCKSVADGSSKTLFGEVYAAYKLAETPGHAYDVEVERTFSKLFDAIATSPAKVPHAYDVARLAFLGAPYFDDRIIATGRRLLKQNSSDYTVENRLAQVLNWSKDPKDRAQAAKYSSDLASKRPSDPLTHVLIALITYKNAQSSHSKNDAEKCISAYKKALKLLPADSGDAAKVQSFIKFVEDLEKRWSASREH